MTISTFPFQPSWLRPTSARRLLVLRHGPSARLQGVANVADCKYSNKMGLDDYYHNFAAVPETKFPMSDTDASSDDGSP